MSHEASSPMPAPKRAPTRTSEGQCTPPTMRLKETAAAKPKSTGAAGGAARASGVTAANQLAAWRLGSAPEFAVGTTWRKEPGASA